MTRRVVSPEWAAEIRRLHEEEGVSTRELCERFGLHKSTIIGYYKYEGPKDLRLRWLSKLPYMKEQVRKDMLKIKQGSRLEHEP